MQQRHALTSDPKVLLALSPAAISQCLHSSGWQWKHKACGGKNDVRNWIAANPCFRLETCFAQDSIGWHASQSGISGHIKEPKISTSWRASLAHKLLEHIPVSQEGWLKLRLWLCNLEFFCISPRLPQWTIAPPIKISAFRHARNYNRLLLQFLGT